MEAVQIRIARPTNHLSEVVNFYTKGLGFQILGHFENHMGYDGIMLGLPGSAYHLEFTRHINQKELPEPSKENLLVFYFNTSEKYEHAVYKLQQLNIQPVEPENPYWKEKSKTYEDPDKWRIVLFNGIYQY